MEVGRKAGGGSPLRLLASGWGDQGPRITRRRPSCGWGKDGGEDLGGRAAVPRSLRRPHLAAAQVPANFTRETPETFTWNPLKRITINNPDPTFYIKLPKSDHSLSNILQKKPQTWIAKTTLTRNGCGVAACDQWTSRRVHLLVRCFFFNSIFLVGHLDVSLAGTIFAWHKHVYSVV